VSGRVDFTLRVNGESYQVSCQPRKLLADVLRQDLGLTGTHVGCEHGVCGACTILMNDEPVRSCLLFALQARGNELTTVEGLAKGEKLHPVQQAFWEKFGLQCGFCTPGFLLTTLALLRDQPSPSRQEIREALSGNLCRCTGYHTIVDAVEEAVARLGVGSGESGARPGSSESSPYVGSRVHRVDDPRKLTGRGQYVDDLSGPRMLDVAFVRSPHAHARIRRLDLTAAASQLGVALVLDGEAAAALCSSWTGILSHFEGMKSGAWWPLAREKVRFVGEPVATVAAIDRYTAEDACELVEVEYEPLTAILDPDSALAPGAPLIYDELGDNLVLRSKLEAGDVATAFDRAYRTYRQEFSFGRHTGVTIEPRSLQASYEPATRQLNVQISSQVPHMMQAVLARILGLEEHNVRVICPEVGGSFGIKIHVYQDDVAACLLAIKLGRPVKWVADRRESFVSDIHAREERVEVDLAVERDGCVRGLRARVMAPIGPASAYPRSSVVESGQVARLLPGPYRIQNYACTAEVVAQNKVMTSQYRAVGHPIAAACMEGILDLAARDLGVDPADIRRRNLITANELPYASCTGNVYDSGSYQQALEAVLAAADYGRLRTEQARLRSQGRYLGIGLGCFIEVTGPGAQFYGVGGAPISAADATTVRIEPSGRVTVLIGVTDQGQGTHTSVAQVVADELGVGVDDIRVMSGDTAAVPYGGGTWASRGTPIGSSATLLAARQVRDKIRRAAAHLLEVSADDLELQDRRVFVRGAPERAISLEELARTVHFRSSALPVDLEPSLDATSHFALPAPWTFSNGVHLAVVEVDAQTGLVKLWKYVAADDCGTVINPALVEGQVRGGIAQGIGGALCEEIPYDADGQPLATTLMDYLVPGAAELPDVEVHHLETASPHTLTGAKGVGEGGTAGSPATIMNAVNDALAPLGAIVTQQPITPERVRTAIARSPRS
jgi:carbon-monoxide dehydrogenase large subunit